MRARILSIALCLVGAAAAQAADYSERPEARAMIERLQREHGLAPERIRALLGQAENQPRILEAMRRPAERVLPWHRYRRIFLGQERIAGGADFMREHRGLLERAQTEYGVPAAVIAAIIGVETRYGAHVGDHRVLDALATLGFDYPERARFFLGELEQFFILCHREGVDCAGAKGSYAGAMGWPQFISSSYRAYAVDFDGDGKRDLWNSPADVIGSVANYLAEHGWRSGEAIAVPLAGGDPAGLERSSRKTRHRYRDLAAAGLEAPANAPAPDTEVGLVELEAEDGPEFWAGLDNFFVITSYNHSRLYAMAVYQLSSAIEKRLGAATAGL
jgi:membrane-bound lytic murein transglycosylase B